MSLQLQLQLCLAYMRPGQLCRGASVWGLLLLVAPMLGNRIALLPV